MFSKNITGGIPLMLSESTIQKGHTKVLSKQKSLSVATVALVMFLVCGGIGLAVNFLLPGKQSSQIPFSTKEKLTQGEDNAIKIVFNIEFPVEGTLKEDGNPNALPDKVSKGSVLYKRAGKSYTLEIDKQGWEVKKYIIDLNGEEYKKPRDYTSEYIFSNHIKEIALEPKKEMVDLYSDLEKFLNSTDHSVRNYISAEETGTKIQTTYDVTYKKTQEYLAKAKERAAIIRKKIGLYDAADPDLKKDKYKNSKAVEEYKKFLNDDKFLKNDDFKYFAQLDKDKLEIRIKTIEYEEIADNAVNDASKGEIDKAKDARDKVLKRAQTNAGNLVIIKNNETNALIEALISDIQRFITRVQNSIDDAEKILVLDTVNKQAGHLIEAGKFNEAEKQIAKLKGIPKFLDAVKGHEKNISDAKSYQTEYKKLLETCDLPTMNEVFEKLHQLDRTLFGITKLDETTKADFDNKRKILETINKTLEELDKAYKGKDTTLLHHVFSNADLKKSKIEEISGLPENIKVAISHHKITGVAWPKDAKPIVELNLEITFSYALDVYLNGEEKPSDTISEKPEKPNVKTIAKKNKDGQWLIESYEFKKE